MLTMTHAQTERVEAVRKSLDDMRRPLLVKAEQLGLPNEFVTAMCVASGLNLIGVPADLVAGSAAWLVMSDEMQGEALLENRKPIPFFGYRFNLTQALPNIVKFEYPDDLHSFVVDRDGIIYDFTLADQREAFKVGAGYPWPAKTAPPDIIVGEMDDLVVRGWQYAAEEQASDYVRVLAHRLVMLASFNG